jgi:hypothetical protein
MMLEPDQKKRPTASEALSHQWFKQDEVVIKDLLNFNQTLCRREKSLGGMPLMNAPSEVSPVYRSSNSKVGFGQPMWTGLAGFNVTVVSGGGGGVAGGAGNADETLQSFASFKMATNYFLRNPSLNFLNKNTLGLN